MLTAMAAIEADYEGGVLRPTQPLELREGERVRLIVVRRSEPARWDLDRLAANPDEDRALAEAGLGDWADALDALDRP
jgi:predicted DNA-binding antitoxin AbrB/MazE fold protein